MKRLLVAGTAMLALAGCGGGASSVVGANSSDSTEITAVGTIVGNETAATPTPTPTPSETPTAAATDNATSTDADAVTEAAPAGDDHPSDDGDAAAKQN
jgi:hypothetical protein